MITNNIKAKTEVRKKDRESLKFEFSKEIKECIELVYGTDWALTVKGNEINGLLGIAIVKSIVDGININFNDIAYYLRIPKWEIDVAFNRLIKSGYLLSHNLKKDINALKKKDVHVWCDYAAIAAGIRCR